MKERPILFSAPMVNALCDDRKTHTRRALKSQGWDAVLPSEDHPGEWVPWKDGEAYRSFVCPYGEPGDHLYVRETFRLDVAYDHLKPSAAPETAAVWFKAGGQWGEGVPGKTRVSIHMPRWASRLVLEVEDVRVERLNAITDPEALREGIVEYPDGFHWEPNPTPSDARLIGRDARSAFLGLWEEINGVESRESDPFVWVVSFRKVRA